MSGNPFWLFVIVTRQSLSRAPLALTPSRIGIPRDVLGGPKELNCYLRLIPTLRKSSQGETTGFFEICLLHASVNHCAFHSCLVDGEACSHLRDLFAHLLLYGRIAHMAQHFRDPVADQLHLQLFHPAGCHGRATQTNPASLHRRKWIKRDGVLVHRDSRAIERFFRLASRDSSRVYFDQEQVIIRAP